MTETPAAPADPRMTVFYDGACPLCRREIAFYQRLDHAQRVHWYNVAQAAACPDGLCQADLLARFHVRTAAGRMESGARAFAVLWLELPAPWPVFGRIAQWPGIAWLLECAYRLFLKVRPLMRRWA